MRRPQVEHYTPEALDTEEYHDIQSQTLSYNLANVDDEDVSEPVTPWTPLRPKPQLAKKHSSRIALTDLDDGDDAHGSGLGLNVRRTLLICKVISKASLLLSRYMHCCLIVLEKPTTCSRLG